jgi:hypothetical protein
MKIYFKKKAAVDPYVWRPFFVLLPRLVKDEINETSPIVWLTWVWKRGPFNNKQVKTRTDSCGVKYRIAMESFEYLLDNPKTIGVLRIEGDQDIVDRLILGKEEFFSAKEERHKMEKKIIADYKALVKAAEVNPDILPGTAPEPIEEGASIKKKANGMY